MTVSEMVIQPYQELIDAYSSEIYTSLAGICLPTYQCLLTLWFIYKVLVDGVLTGKLVFEEFVRELFYASVVLMLLASPSIYHDYFIKVLESIVDETARVLLKNAIADGVGNIDNIQGAYVALEKATSKIMEYSEELFGYKSYFNWTPFIVGSLLALPFIGIWFNFTWLTIVYYFYKGAISALFPLLLIFAAVPKTRGFVFQGLKIVAQGALSLLFALAFVGIALKAIETTTNYNWFTGDMLQKTKDSVLLTGAFMACLFNGFFAMKMILQARQLAYAVLGGSYSEPSQPGWARNIQSHANTAYKTIGTMASKGAGYAAAGLVGGAAGYITGSGFQVSARDAVRSTQNAFGAISQHLSKGRVSRPQKEERFSANHFAGGVVSQDKQSQETKE